MGTHEAASVSVPVAIAGPGCVLLYGVYLGEQERWKKHTACVSREWVVKNGRNPPNLQEAGRAAPIVLLEHLERPDSL